MKQVQIIKFILEEKKRQKLTQRELEEKAGYSLDHFPEVLKNSLANSDNKKLTRRGTVGLRSVLYILDALGYRLEIVDKDAVFDNRFAFMPKVLYIAERIESRKVIARDGFFSRVDLYDSPEVAAKNMPGDFDLYSVRVADMNRNRICMTDHPFGIRYSYHDDISPDSIVSRTEQCILNYHAQ